MNDVTLFDILQKFAKVLDGNMDYLHQLNSNNTFGRPATNLLVMLEKSLYQLKKMDTSEVGVLLKFFGRQLQGKNIPFAKAYGKAMAKTGEVISKKNSIGFEDLIMIIRGIIDEVSHEKGKSKNEALQFWSGLTKSLTKGKDEGLTVVQSVQIAIKENQWPMSRGDISSEEQIVLYCTRLVMTILIQVD